MKITPNEITFFADRLKKLTEIEQITQGIPLDRLKELCEAYKLIGQEFYVADLHEMVLAVNRHPRVERDVVESANITESEIVFIGKYYDFEKSDPDIFYGPDARERAEARLEELRGEK